MKVGFRMVEGGGKELGTLLISLRKANLMFICWRARLLTTMGMNIKGNSKITSSMARVNLSKKLKESLIKENSKQANVKDVSVILRSCCIHVNAKKSGIAQRNAKETTGISMKTNVSPKSEK